MNRRSFLKNIPIGLGALFFGGSILTEKLIKYDAPYGFCFDTEPFQAMKLSDVYKFVEVGLRYELAPTDIEVLTVETLKLWSPKSYELPDIVRGLVILGSTAKYWCVGFDPHLFTHDYCYRIDLVKKITRKIKRAYNIY